MAYRFNGTDEYLGLGGEATTYALSQSAFELVVWFRSDSVASTFGVMYGESASGVEIYLANDRGLNGRVRFQIDSGVPAASLEYDANASDGEWHVASGVRVGLTEHHLYVDDAATARASNTATTFTTVAGAAREVATRPLTSGNYFDGDVGQVALFDGPLSVADRTALYAGTKHVNEVESASLVAWAPLVGSDPREVIGTTQYAGIFGTPSEVNGPSGTKAPFGLVATTDISKAWVHESRSSTTIAEPSATASDPDALLREIGDRVTHTPADATYPYKFYCSGSPDPYNGSNVGIIAYGSASKASGWTKIGVALASATLPSEDPGTWVDGSTVHLFAENKTGGNNANGISHSTSSDNGRTFSVQAASRIVHDTEITQGAVAMSDVSSPTTIGWLAGEFYIALEERYTGTDGYVALYKASTIGGAYTRVGIVLSPGASGKWDDASIVPDSVRKIGSTYWLTYHTAGDTLAVGSSGLASSDTLDGTAWTRVELPHPDGLIAMDNAGDWLAIDDAGNAFARDISESTVYLHQMYGTALSSSTLRRGKYGIGLGLGLGL